MMRDVLGRMGLLGRFVWLGRFAWLSRFAWCRSGDFRDMTMAANAFTPVRPPAVATVTRIG